MSNASPNAVSSQSDVIFSIIYYPFNVHNILLNSMFGALFGLYKGGVLIDMTTSDPALAEEIAKANSSKSYFSIDAQVLGRDPGAKNGKLAIFTGGDKATVKCLDPLFSLMSKVNFMGSSGKGQFAKLANQITKASMMLGIMEWLIYAHKAGLDVKKFLEAISTGAAASKSIDLYGYTILKKEF